MLSVDTLFKNEIIILYKGKLLKLSFTRFDHLKYRNKSTKEISFLFVDFFSGALDVNVRTFYLIYPCMKIKLYGTQFLNALFKFAALNRK